MSPIPTYSLKIEDRERFLFAHVEAPQLTVDVAERYLVEVAEAARSLRAKRVMVLREIPGTFTETEQFHIAHKALEMFQGIKICWVNPYAENCHSLDFGAMVANNRGAEFGMFTNEAEAAVWLTQD